MTEYGGFDQLSIINKFELTDMVYNDMNTVDDFNRNILKNNGPDKETLASDVRRKNVYSDTRINMRENGTRWKNEPIHLDLCLELTDFEPRGVQTDPDIQKMTKNYWSRKDDYKHSFIPTADYSIPSHGVSEGQVQLNKRKARERVAKMYYKDFSTSKDGFAIPYNQRFGTKSKAGYVEHTNELIDINDEYNIEKRRDITTILSNLLPIGHLTTTDNMFNVANYGLLYGQKNINLDDYLQNTYKTSRSSKKIIENKENELAKQLHLFISDIQRNKEKLLNKNQDIKFGDIKNSQYQNNNKYNKESYTNLDLFKSEDTHKISNLVEEIVTNYKKQVNNYDKYKDFNKSDMTLPENSKKNNDLLTYITKVVSNKNNIRLAMNNIIESHNKEKMNYSNNKLTKIYQNNSKLPNLQKLNNKTIVDFKNKIKNNIESFNSLHYKTNTQENITNNYDKIISDFDYNSLIKDNTDELTTIRKTNLNLPDIASKDNIHLDNSFGNSKYLNRNNGKIGNKYLFKYNLIDNNNNNNQLNEQINNINNGFQGTKKNGQHIMNKITSEEKSLNI